MVPKNFGILCLLAILTLHATGQAGFTENRGQWQEPFLYKADIATGVSVFIDQHALIFNLAELSHREEDMPLQVNQIITTSMVMPFGLFSTGLFLKTFFREILSPDMKISFLQTIQRGGSVD